MTSNSLTYDKEHDIPSQILKTILDCMIICLDPYMCGFWYICMLASSQTIKTATIWHILLCPFFIMYSYAWILSLFGTNDH